MGRLFITGDTHRDFTRISDFCDRANTTRDGAIVVLGDACVNYYGGLADASFKRYLAMLPITFLFVHGNHEPCPTGRLYVSDYWYTDLYEGYFTWERGCPSLLYMRDGCSYDFYEPDGTRQRAFVIGGAYSVDGPYRRAHGIPWFTDEQLTEEQRAQVYAELLWHKSHGVGPNWFFTHTCPLTYVPRDMFLPGIDQSTVDDSMERFLGKIAQEVPYERWYCGHWHTDRLEDRVRFMYKDILQLI